MRVASLLGALFVIAGCLGCFSESLEDRLNRGMDMVFEGRYEDAESHFLTLGRELARSENPDAHIWQALALYRAGRIEHLYLDQPRRAVARLREALKLDPYAKFAFEARKEIAYIFYDRLRDYRTAALEFERLVSAFSDRKGIEEYHYRIAQCYFLLREFSQARTEARLLLEIQKQGELAAETMLLVANSYYVEGRYQEAAEAYQDLLAIHPSEEIESRSRFELGTCFLELGQYKQAERNLLLALKTHPRPDMVRMQLKALQVRMSEEKAGKQGPSTAGSKPHIPQAAPGTAPKPQETTRPISPPREGSVSPKTAVKPKPAAGPDKKPPASPEKGTADGSKKEKKPTESKEKPKTSPPTLLSNPGKEKAESPKPAPKKSVVRESNPTKRLPKASDPGVQPPGSDKQKNQ